MSAAQHWRQKKILLITYIKYICSVPTSAQAQTNNFVYSVISTAIKCARVKNISFRCKFYVCTERVSEKLLCNALFGYHALILRSRSPAINLAINMVWLFIIFYANYFNICCAPFFFLRLVSLVCWLTVQWSFKVHKSYGTPIEMKTLRQFYVHYMTVRCSPWAFFFFTAV